MAAFRQGVNWWKWDLVQAPNSGVDAMTYPQMSFADSLEAHRALDALGSVNRIIRIDLEPKR